MTNQIISVIAVAGFGSLWMLLWGAAALVPLVIHLWSRSHYQEAPWAAMEFLLDALRQNARRIRLEQWLLLAIRMAIPIVLALAMADPIFSRFSALGTSLPGRSPRHSVLVIDGSYSMDYQNGDLTRFQQAKQVAREVIEEGQQGDGTTLILMSDPPHVVIGSPAFDAEDVDAEIDSLQLRHAGADLADTLDLVIETIDLTRLHHPRLQQHHVYIITDLGANTWQAASSARVRRQIADIDEAAETILVDVGADHANNVAIANLQQRDEIVPTTGDATFQATVHNFGAQDLAVCQIDLLVDDRLVARQPVAVAAYQESTVNLGYQFDAPGEHWVEARLAADALEVDNHRYLAVPVRQALRVLCVSGKPGSARNVALALAPAGDASRIETRIIPENLLVELDLLKFDCIFVCNVGRFGRDEAGVLRDFLHSGRGLVFFLGDQVQLENYNLELGGELTGQRILPAKLASLAPENTFRFDPQDYRHPLVSPFRGHERAGLLTTPTWRYFRLQPYPDTQAQVALWFTSGDPAILEEEVGRGRSILVATAASAQSVYFAGDSPSPWTAWPSWPSFPPIIQELLVRATGTRFAHRNVLVGQALESGWLAMPAEQTVTISTGAGPDRTEELVRTRTAGDKSFWTFEPTYRSGIYHAAYSTPDALGKYFAVNIVAARESDLSRVESDQLPHQFRRQVLVDDDQTADVVRNSAPLFRALLGLLLVLLLSETAVAWYLGTART